MTNKEKIFAIIHNYPLVMEEVKYFLDVYEDDPEYDIFDAFDEASSLADEYPEDTKLWNQFKKIYIEIGYCVPVDIKKVMVSSGKKYWFKKEGKYYECVSSWEQFVNK